MASYKLRNREGTCTFQKITCGKRWVGRVCRHASGKWLGVMGRLIVEADTPTAAFEAVVAKHLGYADAAALHARNRSVRAANRARRQHTQALARRFLQGNLQEQMTVLDEIFANLK